MLEGDGLGVDSRVINDMGNLLGGTDVDLPLEDGGKESADPEEGDDGAEGVKDWFQLIDVECPAIEAKASDRQVSKGFFISVWCIKGYSAALTLPL